MSFNTLEEIQEFININVEIDKLKPFFRQAKREFLNPFISSAQVRDFDALRSQELSSTDPRTEALSLYLEAVANFGVFLYLPSGAVKITDLGVNSEKSDYTEAASDKQFKEVLRSHKRAGHLVLDELLKILHKTPSEFPSFAASEEFSEYDSLLIRSAKEFNKYYYIFSSPQTFNALAPTLRTCEDQFLTPSLGIAALNELKALKSPENQSLELLELVKKALASFVISRTMENGLFVLDAKGVSMRFDVLAYEKNLSLSNSSKLSGFVSRTRDNKLSEGENYLKRAVLFIEQNPGIIQNPKPKKTARVEQIKTSKGVIGI